LCAYAATVIAVCSGCKRSSNDTGEASSSAVQGIRIDIPSDPKATYFVIEKSGTPPLVVLTTKRVGPSGTSYTTREFNCVVRTAKDLADGDSLAEFRSSKKQNEKPYPFVDGSIVDVLWQHACAASEGANKPEKSDVVDDSMAKMVEFKDEMCKCKDAKCAQVVSDKLTKWSHEQTKNQKEPPKMSEEDTMKAAQIGEAMGNCMRAAMGD